MPEKIFEKHGVRYNGFRIPYPVIGAFMLVVSATSVALYQIQNLEDWRDVREAKIIELDKKMSVIDSRLKNIEYLLQRRER